MKSIYGPPPGARQPRRRSAKQPTPRWKQALQGVTLLLVGLAAFALLVALEASSGDDAYDDPLRRLDRIHFEPPRYDPSLFDIPVFKPLQSADLIPSSAIHPAEATATKPPRPLQTADIISR